MKVKKEILLKEAQNLADFITKNCIGKSGLVASRTHLFKRKAYGRALVSDLGDYVPLFYWLGKLTEDERYIEWAEHQTKLAAEFCQMPCGLFYTEFNSNNTNPPLKHNFRVFSMNDLGDTIVGINLMYELTGKQIYKNLALKFFDGLLSFTTRDGFVCSHGIPSLQIYSPFSYSGYCGIFIEELSRLYQFTQARKYLTLAKRLAEPWVSDKFFKEHGLFPFKFLGKLTFPLKFLVKIYTSFSPSTVKVMKGNTNLLFGLLSLYKVDKDEKWVTSIERWIENIRDKLLSPHDIFYSLWDVKRGGCECTLEANHAILDVLLEAFMFFKNKYVLKLIESCTNSWITYQKNGLMPERIESQLVSRLDPQVDFAIVLLKLHEITHKRKYYTSALRSIKGIISHHKLDGGYVEFVNIKTKEKKHFIIETKFLSLLLKLFLLAYEVLDRKRIYEDNVLKDLIRDR